MSEHCHIEDLLAQRLWYFLTAPQDLQCRAVSASFATSTRCGSASQADGHRLMVLHLVDIDLDKEKANKTDTLFSLGREPPELSIFMQWALRRVALASLQSLWLPCIKDKLLSLVKFGASDWVEWILAAACFKTEYGTLFCSIDSANMHPASTYSFERSDHELEDRSGRLATSVFADSLGLALIAASKTTARMVEVLLAAGANLSWSDENGGTALHWAAMEGHDDICRVLLDARADPNARDDDDWTPLCLAADSGHANTCEVLLNASAGINLADEDGRSPLWHASYAAHRSVVKLLLLNSADPGQADDSGRTAMSLGVG